jgi:hypothetical protein
MSYSDIKNSKLYKKNIRKTWEGFCKNLTEMGKEGEGNSKLINM